MLMDIIRSVMSRVLCFLGFHDWFEVKSIIVKEHDELFIKTTLLKCATCPACLNRIEEAVLPGAEAQAKGGK